MWSEVSDMNHKYSSAAYQDYRVELSSIKKPSSNKHWLCWFSYLFCSSCSLLSLVGWILSYSLSFCLKYISYYDRYFILCTDDRIITPQYSHLVHPLHNTFFFLSLDNVLHISSSLSAASCNMSFWVGPISTGFNVRGYAAFS